MSQTVRVGVQLPEVERRVLWPELIDMARTAEAVGVDSIWVGDHLLYDLPGGLIRGPWEVWTTLAALAAVTNRVELGPLVASIGFHAPAMLAKQAATVDGISDGRLIVGLGAGWNEREYRAFDFPFDRRAARFSEALTIISTLLREGRIDFHGEFHDLEDCVLDPPPTRAGGPPLMVGSTGSRVLTAALPVVDSWNAWYSHYGNTVDGFIGHRARVDELVLAVGRDPAAIGATAAVLVRLPGGDGRLMGHYAVSSPAPVEGSPSAIAAHVAALGDAGAGHVQLVLDPITTASIELVGEALAELRRYT
jgi:alkanesulfonate monooxygenase SsuD/methylene tetrahydromethanopterin reductase-like flavin-dependent oxidoreductase (luciferase family)